MPHKTPRSTDFFLCAGFLALLNCAGSLGFWAAEERWPALAPFRPAVMCLATGVSLGLFSTLAPTARTKAVATIATTTLFVAALILTAVRFA